MNKRGWDEIKKKKLKYDSQTVMSFTFENFYLSHYKTISLHKEL